MNYTSLCSSVRPGRSCTRIDAPNEPTALLVFSIRVLRNEARFHTYFLSNLAVNLAVKRMWLGFGRVFFFSAFSKTRPRAHEAP